MTPPDPATSPDPAPTSEPIAPAEPADKNLSPSDVLDHTLKARAQRAERQAAQLETKLVHLNEQLQSARAAVVHTEQSHQLDLALSAAGAVDLDTARLLAQRVTTAQPDLPAADIVAQLTREKPFLFRVYSPAHTAMSPHQENSSAPLITAAQRAATTGQRAALLDYLRIRRSA